MEKFIEIDGKQIGFKSSAAFLIRYRDFFGRDGLKDLNDLIKGAEEGEEGVESFITCQRIIWCLAKTYNKKISVLEDWLDCFDEFNTAEVFKELMPLIKKSLGITEEIEGEGAEEKNALSAMTAE